MQSDVTSKICENLKREARDRRVYDGRDRHKPDIRLNTTERVKEGERDINL